MMAQHSDVGRRRRLQKPYHPYVRAPTRWSLQEVTLDHLVVASLRIGGGLHPAGPEPARETTPLYMHDARAKIHVARVPLKDVPTTILHAAD